jgi:hypothetical protein
MTDDPKAKMTAWLTEGLRKPQDTTDFDRTRVMSPEQMAWYKAALALDDDYFTHRVIVDMHLMMSFKGRRSDDVVEALRSVKQDDKIMSGVQPVTEELRKRNKYSSGD